MSDILFVYGTEYGQTAKIVTRLVAALERKGHRVTMWQGDRLPESYALEYFDLIVVAASVLFGRHQRYIREFVKCHRERLSTTPAAFISVCGILGSQAPDAEERARGYVDGFLEKTGWEPRVTRSFAGALNYTEYGWLRRWIMKKISQRTGRPTDTSRDHELTDWGRVEQFAAELADLLGGARSTEHTGRRTAARVPMAAR